MNRAERRRLKHNQEGREPVYNVRQSDLEAAKQKAAQKAIDAAFILMLSIPVMVMRDKYGWGKKRLPEFMDYVVDLYDGFNRGYFTLDDLIDVIRKETGVNIMAFEREQENGTNYNKNTNI